MTMEDDDDQLKITWQLCNGFVTCSGNIGELLYIPFLGAGMSNLGIYLEEIFPENFYFWWPSRTKIQPIYHMLLKEGDGYHKNLRFPGFRDKTFEVMC